MKGKKVSEKKKLVIVESPAKAKTINKYLGEEYKVLSSKGHLIDLPKSRLGVDIENNFKPEYIVLRGKNPILKELKKAARHASEILLAADPDREGEAISWHLKNALQKINPNIKRIVFHEITKEAIKEAVKNPRDIDMDRVNAQQARRILDRLVGYNLSPLLWKKVKAGLSAGRVQSVALRLICEREDEIKKFVPEEFWSIEVEFVKNGYSFKAKLSKINNEKPVIKSKEEAEKIKQMIMETAFHIGEIKERERKKNPPAPYITSKLQQDGLNRLGFPAQKTMRIAQTLYEGVEIQGEGMVGLITYMRTDSTRIADVALNQVRDFIKTNFGEEYLPEKPNVYKSKETAQEAHEAIRPTSVMRTPESIKSSLSPDQYKLYKLIYERFVASQMKPAILKQKTMTITGTHRSGTSFLLQINASEYVFEGFTKVLSYIETEKGDNLPDIKINEKVDVKEIFPSQHFTQPPPRYSDASLVKTLEELGIGRPSTYAPTIATLESRYYITREGRQLVPTALGMLVNSLLVKKFPELINTKFTAEMEEKLDKIAVAEINWVDMLKEFYPEFIKTVENAYKTIEEIEDYKKGIPTDEVCEKCGAPMVKKLGRYGFFLACSNFPKCRNAKPYPIADCPVPGCDGKIVVRISKKRRQRFYGCTNYPKCNYLTKTKPLEEKCPKCGYWLTYQKKGKKLFKKCTNPECDFIIPVEENEPVEE